MIFSMLLAAVATAPAVEAWTPPAISSDQFESHAAFDPRTGDLWFVRSKPDFTGWRLKLSHCTATGWSAPEDPPFPGDGVEADPWFEPDGRTLWFISSRSTDGLSDRGTDIWKVERDATGRWGTPQRLPAPVNSPAYEWFPHLGRDGWLYFGSGQPGGLGRTDIWRAHQVKGGWKAENLGPNINTAGDEYEPLPSPDGKRLIVQAGDSYFESRRTADGWGPKVKLGPEVNVNGTEIGATFSPSGRSMLFARDGRDGRSGEFLVWRTGEPEAWPPKCPR
jgi:hypothetical protein